MRCQRGGEPAPWPHHAPPTGLTYVREAGSSRKHASVLVSVGGAAAYTVRGSPVVRARDGDPRRRPITEGQMHVPSLHSPPSSAGLSAQRALERQRRERRIFFYLG